MKVGKHYMGQRVRTLRAGKQVRTDEEAMPRHCHLWGALPYDVFEFLNRRLQTSMTRATVEDSTAGLGQTLRTRRLVVGALPFHDVSRMCMH